MLQSIKKIKINLTVATNYFDTIQGKEAPIKHVISGQIDLNFHKSKKSKEATQTVQRKISLKRIPWIKLFLKVITYNGRPRITKIEYQKSNKNCENKTINIFS